MLKDQFNREHDYLRISITDSCNFRCVYCMPQGNINCLPKNKLMQPNEIYSIAKEFVNLGVKKIRLTGGEPLVRNDFEEIINKLSALPVELALTTNGVYLGKYLEVLKRNKVKSINISIDSLHVDKFKNLTQRDALYKVWDNITLFIEEGFKVKLNVVAMKGVNEEEFTDFIELTKNNNIEVRFIEFMPFDGNSWSKNKLITEEEIIQKVKTEYTNRVYKVEDKISDTARHFKIEGYKGVFAFISTMSHAFCSSCSRLRLTADGKMKNCLFSEDETNILKALRENRDVASLIQKNVYFKKAKKGGQFDEVDDLILSKLKNRSMVKIGG